MGLGESRPGQRARGLPHVCVPAGGSTRVHSLFCCRAKHPEGTVPNQVGDWKELIELVVALSSQAPELGWAPWERQGPGEGKLGT